MDNNPRRSSRCNKNVPPKRYSESENGRSNLIQDSITVKDIIPSENHTDTKSQSCVKVSLRSEFATSTKQNNTSASNSNASTIRSNSNKSIKSRQSSCRELNLQLKLLEQQKQFNEEEKQEKLKFIEKKHQIALKEIEIKEQLKNMNEGNVDYKSNYSESLYKNPNHVKDWILNSKKCTSIRSSKQKKEDSDKHSSFSVGRDNNTLLKIATECMQNTANTKKFLTNLKMNDLPHFSGEITEWPIFISEFKRSNEQCCLSDYDNLLRLDRALKGKARETVKALLTSPDNIPKIIKMLEMNFGRADWIVLSLMDKVKKLGLIKEDNIDSCISFSNAINNMIITMKNVNSTLYLFNPELLANLVEKLPSIQKYSWGKFKYQRDLTGCPTSLEDFAYWYEEEMSAFASICNPFQKSKLVSKKENIHYHANGFANKVEHSICVCVFCNDATHEINKCDKFLEKSVEERRKIVSSMRLCFLCLKKGHMINRCFVKKRCGTNSCKGRHNHLLHVDYNHTIKDNKQAVSDEFCGNLTSIKNETVLLRIAPVIIRGPVKEIHTFALFDEGSTCSMIEEQLIGKLEVSGPIVPLCFQWTNEITHYEDNSKIISIDVKSQNLRT